MAAGEGFDGEAEKRKHEDFGAICFVWLIERKERVMIDWERGGAAIFRSDLLAQNL